MKITELIVNKNIIEIIIKHNKNYDAFRLIEYLNQFEKNDEKVFVSDLYNNKVEISINDVIYFYSLKRSNYCKTANEVYRIKNRLMELNYNNFIPISRTQIVNYKHIVKFDTSFSSELKIILDNGEILFVSRRRIKEIMKEIRERSI